MAITWTWPVTRYLNQRSASGQTGCMTTVTNLFTQLETTPGPFPNSYSYPATPVWRCVAIGLPCLYDPVCVYQTDPTALGPAQVPTDVRIGAIIEQSSPAARRNLP